MKKDAKIKELESTIADLSDVLEAHAIHGDHTDEQLQKWADFGRKAIGQYPTDTKIRLKRLRFSNMLKKKGARK